MKLNRDVALVVLALVCLGLIACGACSAPIEPSTTGEAKAAVVDQLYALRPNETFTNEITQELGKIGYKVDVYRGDAVTVDLYRKLPSYGYGIIIFRVHSGLLGVDPKVSGKTWLFTSEVYSTTKHVSEQLSDQVTYAKTSDDAPWVFAICDKFIAQSMEGQFNNTAIIMMGCDCLHFEDLARAFIQKGASAYLAWDVSVTLDYVDDATLALIKKLCSKDLTIEVAVAQTMKEKGPDPKYGAVLKYYPPESGNKTLKQLLK